MATLVRVSDHTAQALNRLAEQFKGKPRIAALISSLTDRTQEFENVALDLYLQRWVTSATGVSLDNLGAIVGEARNGHADDEYRLWILARIQVNRSNGKGDEILTLLALLLQSDEGFRVDPRYPAAFEVSIDELPTDLTADEIFQILSAARGAGVGMVMIYSLPPGTSGAFTWAEGTDMDVDSDKGWAPADSSSGGKWAGALG